MSHGISAALAAQCGLTLEQVDRMSDLQRQAMFPPPEPETLGTLGRLEVIPCYKEDGKTKDSGGMLSLGFGLYHHGGTVEISGGDYLTCGIPGDWTPTQVAEQLRKFADHIDEVERQRADEARGRNAARIV